MSPLLEAGSAVLVSRAVAGESDAWARLVDRFGGMVISVARGYGLSATDAADVSQTVWLRLLEQLSRIQNPDRIGGWLATTTQRESLRVRRRAERQVLVEDDKDLEPSLPAVEPDTGLLDRERDKRVAGAFDRLSPRCRAMLGMLVGDERPNYKQLSEALDMPPGSIGPTRMRCLDCLRRLYESADGRE